MLGFGTMFRIATISALFFLVPVDTTLEVESGGVFHVEREGTDPIVITVTDVLGHVAIVRVLPDEGEELARIILEAAE